MITKVRRSDVPSYGMRERSPLRRFAEETVEEFLGSSEAGEVAEVTGAPVRDGAAGTRALAASLRDALFRREGGDMRGRVRVITRGGMRVFLEMYGGPSRA